MEDEDHYSPPCHDTVSEFENAELVAISNEDAGFVQENEVSLLCEHNRNPSALALSAGSISDELVFQKIHRRVLHGYPAIIF